jgi:hypothetical protein
MARLSFNSRAEKAAEHGPYCAFKSDRDRLWALISRDVRLVLIAIVIGTAQWVPTSWLF